MDSYSNYILIDNSLISKLPVNWTIRRFKFICTEITDGSHFSPESVDDGFPYITVKDIEAGEVNISNSLKISESDFLKLEKAGCRPKINSVLFSKDGTIGKTAIVKHNNFVVLSSLAILTPKDSMAPKFLHYYIQSKIGKEQIASNYKGSALRRITLDEVVNLQCIVPTPLEQISIANFLDHKTAQIDNLIAEKERLLKLLEEKRIALITRAVTKGLDPNVKMKPSGIDWLGDIPEHWEVKKLKYLVQMKSGEFISSEQISPDGDFPVMGGNGLRGYTDKYTHSGIFILIGRQGALCGNINIGCGKFYATEHAVVLSPINLFNTEWMRNLLEIMNLNQYSQTAAQPGLSVELIKNLQIPLPPKEEQLQLGKTLRDEEIKNKSLYDELVLAIEKLKEYRISLITAAVTGKIDVRDFTPEEEHEKVH